jgi:hypothetical protein
MRSLYLCMLERSHLTPVGLGVRSPLIPRLYEILKLLLHKIKGWIVGSCLILITHFPLPTPYSLPILIRSRTPTYFILDSWQCAYYVIIYYQRSTIIKGCLGSNCVIDCGIETTQGYRAKIEPER